MRLFKYPLIVFWLSFSFIAMVLSVFLGLFLPNNIMAVIGGILLSQAASSIFFPIVVSYFYDRFSERERGDEIWRIFREFADGGILRVYKDREEGDNPDNAVNELRKSFYNHRRGEIRIIGVSLRVFFNPTGPFYQPITATASREGDVRLKVLLLDPNSPEAKNRADIETPGIDPPLIKQDIALTLSNLTLLRRSFPNTSIHFAYYQQAPYCTLVLFPDKCFFSPNLLSKIVPVRLPMIVFRKDSHGYKVLSAYFDYLWDKRIPIEEE